MEPHQAWKGAPRKDQEGRRANAAQPAAALDAGPMQTGGLRLLYCAFSGDLSDTNGFVDRHSGRLPGPNSLVVIVVPPPATGTVTQVTETHSSQASGRLAVAGRGGL